MNDDDFRKVVVDIFKKWPHRKLNEQCVKVWRTDRMNLCDILRGCNFVKSLGFNTIVYNCIVPLKEKISVETGIHIVDGNDLIVMCIRNDELLKFEGLIRYNK